MSTEALAKFPPCRYEQHTKLCTACKGAHDVVNKLKHAAQWTAVILGLIFASVALRTGARELLRSKTWLLIGVAAMALFAREQLAKLEKRFKFVDKAEHAP